ncbi:MAG: aminoglycoside phosphotransferase [Bacteroidia bacterium]
MTRLFPQSLSKTCNQALSSYQAEIDRLTLYEDRIEKARQIWPHRKQNNPFEEVKEKLAAMCSGARRCHYCEDSYADEIEHFFPKVIFPEKTFVWNNFLLACGPCNSPKSNKFAIFEKESREQLNLTSQYSLKKVRKQPPPIGDPVLINPRNENPLDFLFLDINDSFMFTEIEEDEESEAYQRAYYTIQILKLNIRDDLVRARKSAYGNYKARLREYIIERNLAQSSKTAELIQNIQQELHPTVWAEMKRQHNHIPELNELFSTAPEALSW